MDTEKKFQSLKEIKDKIQELEQNDQPWSLITQRGALYDRIVSTFKCMFPLPAYPLLLRLSPEIVMFMIVLLVLVKVISSWWMILMFIYVPYAIFASSIRRAFRIRTFLKNKTEIVGLVKDATEAEIFDYEESLYKQQKELDALSQHDPLKELTKEKDSKYGYMSPEQLKAYWQEEELPRRQAALQKKLDKLNSELAYIHKEFSLLEEIEKS